ncbi:ER membrane protein complex subunit-like protein [Pleurostoma richardsiae]|uniref:ER membrane protein complex subunit-like protein n=1 Tax=Pleurostoma richardsiae TaxID=41990 RepID=A0AA38R825_9PEZI|nr:ER membrane protein complex subunit-like protein [Pleurostoma richardsiae]
MRLSPLALLGALLPAALASALSPAKTTTLTLRVPASHALPNPWSLPPSTHATLSSLHQPRRSAPLTTANGFVFRDVAPGSYLLDVHCPTHAFAPLRVDVLEQPPAGAGAEDGKARVKVWETYRGNDWDNRGEVLPADGEGVFEVRPLGGKNYFMERSKFSVFSILKNPMILVGLVSMGLFFGMPYLVDNMDPEMREEWEKSQKSNPMNSLMGGAQPGQNPMGNFDMAAFLAGSQKKEDSPAPSGNGGSQKKGGRR